MNALNIKIKGVFDKILYNFGLDHLIDSSKILNFSHSDSNPSLIYSFLPYSSPLS